MRPVAPWGLLDLVVFVLIWFLAINVLAGLWKANHANIVNANAPASSEASESVAAERELHLETTEESSLKSEALETSPKIAKDASGKEMPNLELSLWLSLAQVIAMVITSLWLCKRANLALDRIGWDCSRLVSDVIFGGVAGLISIPFMYLILLGLTQLVEHPGTHPLVEQVTRNPSSFVYAFIVAAVIAPITEEFIFRVLLQGYLDSMSAGRVSLADVCVGRRSIWPILSISYSPPLVQTMEHNFANSEDESDAFPSQSDGSSSKGRQIVAGIPPRLDISEPLSAAPRSEPGLISIYGVHDAPVDPRSLPWWPIFVSGMIFGLVHYSYGIGWIPLILFGCLLGWLYRMTGTIWASWIVHVMLNTMSLMALYINIANEQLPKS